MIIRKYLNSILLFFLVFLFIYGPTLDGPLGPFLDIALFVSVFLFLKYLLFFHSKPNIFDAFFYQLSACIYLILIVCLFNILFLDAYNVDVSMRTVFRPIRVYIIIVGSLCLAWYFCRQLKATNLLSIAYFAFLSVVLHSFIMILQFFVPEFRDFVYQFTTAKYVVETYQATRMAGLAGAGGAQLSIMQSFGLILAVYIFVEEKSPLMKFFIFLCSQFVLMSVFLSGRSGFITALVFCPLYFCYLSFLRSGFLGLKNIVVGFSFSLLGVLCLVFLVQSYLLEDPIFLSVFNRVFDSFIDYQETGSFQVNTLNVLSNMVILPQDALHLLFGRASYLDNALYNIGTDIGYFRIIWGYGIIGSFFHYLFYFLCVLKIINLKSVYSREKSLPIVLLLLALFFNSKEILVFTKMTFQITILLVFYLVLVDKERRGKFV